MAGSGDIRVSPKATEWRAESRYYRRSPGWGWALGALLIPLLFGWLGWSAVKPPTDVTVPTVTVPTVAVPALNSAPLSIVRNGSDFTVTGELPDLAAKDRLLGTLKTTLGTWVNLIDKLTVTAGVGAPDLSGIGATFKAAGEIPDFNLNLAGDTVTLTGTAPTDQVKAAVETAARSGWPNTKVVNNIALKIAPAESSGPAAAPAAGSCEQLQASIDSALVTPIDYQKEGFSLTPGSRAELSAVAAAIKACPDVRVTVIGHTDNTGDDEVNLPLSENRARAVTDYLVSQGVPAGSVTTKGVGSADPVASNDTAEGRAQNRRTEIKVD